MKTSFAFPLNFITGSFGFFLTVVSAVVVSVSSFASIENTIVVSTVVSDVVVAAAVVSAAVVFPMAVSDPLVISALEFLTLLQPAANAIKSTMAITEFILFILKTFLVT